MIIAITIAIAIYHIYLWTLTPTPYPSRISIEHGYLTIDTPIHLEVQEIAPSLYLIIAKEHLTVKLDIVIVKSDLSYKRFKAFTPFTISHHESEFLVVFAGSTVAHIGEPPSGTYYVTKHGVFLNEPKETPYLFVNNGKVLVNPLTLPPAPGEVIREIPIIINGTLMEVGLRE